jgi:hypothetical protein
MTTTITPKKATPIQKASFERIRSRLASLEKIGNQMKDCGDEKLRNEYSTVVGIVADLRTEVQNWQDHFTDGD